MSILLTGGTGYIGSHTAVNLLENGYEVILLDNLSNSYKDVLKAIKKITHKDFKFYEGDYKDLNLLNEIFSNNKIDGVINLAGYKSVGESIKYPIKYYINNVSGTLAILSIMQKFNVKKFIFSSSATVYGNCEKTLIKEEYLSNKATNCYGTTKIFIEKILTDLYEADKSFAICILRYFNPIGIHHSGLLKENPKGEAQNLVPCIMRKLEEEKELYIYGNDYNTFDGTCIRDYINIEDLAEGHRKALEKLEKEQKGLFIYNLGVGKGFSVMQVIKAIEKLSGKKINYSIKDRRTGDVDQSFSDVSKAKKELNFIAKKQTLEAMLQSLFVNIY